MNDRIRTFEVDRITLTGLEVTPDRAEHIRTRLEAELRHRLQREGLPRGLPNSRLNHLRAPDMYLAGTHGDGSVAHALAGSIYHALRDAGSSGRG
jgi:hypothetical protein